MFRKILIPIDAGDRSHEAAEFGLRLAQYHGATVLFVSVVELELIYLPPVAFSADGEVYEGLLTDTRKNLQSLQQLGRRMGLTVRTIVREGNPAEEILDVAGREQVDLIVMAPHSHGKLADLLLGCVSQAVLRQAGCPVLIRGAQSASRYNMPFRTA